MLTPRLFYLLLFMSCLLLLGYGLYLEYVYELEPCSLCILQRIAFITVMTIAFTGTVHNPQHTFRVVYNILLVMTALVGVGIAGRQTWLQHLPPELIPECGPGLEYMLEVFPFAQALRMILSGSGECAKVHWSFIGFSIAEWSLLCFALIIIATITATVMFKPERKPFKS